MQLAGHSDGRRRRSTVRTWSIGLWSTVDARVPHRVSRMVSMPQYVWKTRTHMYTSTKVMPWCQTPSWRLKA